MLASSSYLREPPSDLVDGVFRRLEGDGITTRDPARPSTVVWCGTPVAAHAEEGVAAARRALPGWSALEPGVRRAHLERWRETCVAHAPRLAAAIAREIVTPPPATMTGRWAWSSAWTAACTAAGSAPVR